MQPFGVQGRNPYIFPIATRPSFIVLSLQTLLSSLKISITASVIKSEFILLTLSSGICTIIP
ncbi:GSCOCG00008971001-RA-CDS [Cotesia congregata]|nr:GSCOCG00008971001-RA-CDS [Cotesia congregata]